MRVWVSVCVHVILNFRWKKKPAPLSITKSNQELKLRSREKKFQSAKASILSYLNSSITFLPAEHFSFYLVWRENSNTSKEK